MLGYVDEHLNRCVKSFFFFSFLPPDKQPFTFPAKQKVFQANDGVVDASTLYIGVVFAGI